MTLLAQFLIIALICLCIQLVIKDIYFMYQIRRYVKLLSEHQPHIDWSKDYSIFCTCDTTVERQYLEIKNVYESLVKNNQNKRD